MVDPDPFHQTASTTAARLADEGEPLWWPTSSPCPKPIRAAVGAAAALLSLHVPVHAAFDVVGQGARPIALAGAFAAASNDPETVWYNPAGSAGATRVGIGLTHAQLYPGLDESPSVSGLSAQVPLLGGGAQAGLSLLAYEDWSEQVLVAGYGRSVHPRVAVGANVTSLSWQIGDLSRRAFSVDLGGQYEVGWVSHQAYVRVALTVGNLARANISASGHRAGRTPRSVVAAASVDMGRRRLLVDLQREGGISQMRAGYETRPEGWAGVHFRMGGNALTSQWDAGGLNAGLGHVWREWQFDYAYSYPLALTGFGGTHRVSVRWMQRP